MVKNIFPKNRAKTKNKKKTNSTRLAINLLVLGCVILVGVTGWLWWAKIVVNPDRVLNDTISNNLRTKSITKHVSQSGPEGGVEQTAYLSFFPPDINAQTKTILSQGSGSKTASITTDTIGTKTADYVRYSDVAGAEGLPGAERLNDLLGVWAKRQSNPANGEQLTFLNETIFNVMLFGDLDNEQKTKLEELIYKSNLYQYSSAEKRLENKRLVYVYDVSINPEDLVTVIQEYVRLTGVADADQFDPAQYKGVPPVKVQLTIDVFSRQLQKIEYSTGRVETYSGQNLFRPDNIPEQTIPIDELQKKLQGA
ncbi:MAG TPA: hypothetical protein VD947_04450 [Patescibacteria group bacterium]|nr:hypothetical protein [Patescibacteria group bacterium]